MLGTLISRLARWSDRLTFRDGHAQRAQCFGAYLFGRLADSRAYENDMDLLPGLDVLHAARSVADTHANDQAGHGDNHELIHQLNQAEVIGETEISGRYHDLAASFEAAPRAPCLATAVGRTRAPAGRFPLRAVSPLRSGDNGEPAWYRSEGRGHG